MLFGSTAGYVAYRAFRLLAQRVWRTPTIPRAGGLLNATGGALMAAPFAMVGYGALIERLDFKCAKWRIPVPNLPDGLDGMRLLHLSDIHLSAFLVKGPGAGHRHRQRTASAPGLDYGRPDHCRGRSPGRPVCGSSHGCAQTPASSPAWAITRITRWSEDYTEREGARLGIPFLRGPRAALAFWRRDAECRRSGLPATGQTYLRGAEQLVLPGAYNVLLSHNPDVFRSRLRKGYDLTLAGHTHGGQVTVEILHQPINAARFFTPYVYGLYRRGAAAAYVTRGIGTIGIPARIGAPPEIALLRLRKA